MFIYSEDYHMNHLQLPIPEFRRKGFSLLGHAFALLFKNALPILSFIALIAVPIEILKNYYFVDRVGESGFFAMRRSEGITQLLFLSVITPMVVHYILGKMTEAKVNVWPSIAWGLRKWPRMIMYGFLQNVIVFAGLLLFIVPGVFFAVHLMLMPIVVSAENTSRINPLEVSREMARGHFFKFAGYALVGYGAWLAFGLLIGFIVSNIHLGDWFATTVYDVLMDWFGQLLPIILLLVYLQVQTERKDLAQESSDSAAQVE